MINLQKMIEEETLQGYSQVNAPAKVCQDIILKALADGPLSRNVTIKGGVVMRSKTNDTRRATQDLDIDFIRYSLSDESIDTFIHKLNCIEGVKIFRIGKIEELKQQDYSGKRVHIIISDAEGNSINSKIDLGVHVRYEIEQEEYCFDVGLNDEGVSLLINTNEQMFAEKLRSLLRFGPLSTRFKDVFDMYYLSSKIEKEKLMKCLDLYIFNDSKMREKDNASIVKRMKMTFKNSIYRKSLEASDKNWIGGNTEDILNSLIVFMENL